MIDTGLPRNFSQALRVTVPLHERKIQGPPGQAQQRHPNQLLFQEKAHERNTPVEHVLQNQDIHPALVVRQHQIMAIGVQCRIFAVVYFQAGHVLDHPAVAGNPGFSQGNNPALQNALQRFDRQQRFE
jgi:hypothetical protein